MLTGKDRLQFPELPDELPQGAKRKLWLEMNQVICDICEPQQAKRLITSAPQLAEAFRRLQQGKKVRRNRSRLLRKVAAFAVGAAILSSAIYFLKPLEKVTAGSEPLAPVVLPPGGDSNRPVNEVCSIKLSSYPPYATVYENGVKLDEQTPTDFRDFEPGEVVTYRFELDGYKTLEKNYSVPDSDIWVIDESLEVFRPPVDNLIWIDSVGGSYLPRDGYHISGFLRNEPFKRFLRESKTEVEVRTSPFSENGESIEIVLIDKVVASAYTEWLEAKARRRGLLRENQMITYIQDPDLVASEFSDEDRTLGYLPTRMVVKKIPFSSVKFSSDPEGARVYVDGRWIGTTPMNHRGVRPSDIKVEIRMDGFKKYQNLFKVGENVTEMVHVKLEPNDGVVFGLQWRNSLDMPLVPIRKGLMAAVFETRTQDYRAFMRATKYRPYRKPGFRQTGSHPVVGVNLADAQAFCSWLTKKELAEDRISEGQRYKVPTDLEWSELIGLVEDPNAFPSERDHKAQNDSQLANRYYWGASFPPKEVVANLADESAAKVYGVAKSRTIDGYNDGYEKTAPGGMFPANQFGIHDLCGNVYEWVDTSYKSGQSLAVVRGGSWASFSKSHLRVWSRFLISKSVRGNQFGFRIVLVDESLELDE